ncbi:MAG: MBL fold metallo-hydrolase [Candidatus Thorarchaeota archaeon]
MVEIALTENIHVLIGGTFPKCNTIVLLGEQVTVIDPGCSIELLTSFLRQRDLELRNIDHIVLSHIHPDHITFAARIQRLSKCMIIANEITAPLFNDKEKMKEFLGFHSSHPIRPLWEDLVNKRMFGALDTESHVDYILGKNEKFDAGGIVLRPIMTPGHLPDHMCIEFPEHELIFGADIDCTPFGPYYGHPNSSIAEFKQSIDLLQAMEFKGLISGHLDEPLIVDYKTELNSFKFQFDLREDFVMMAISQGAGTIDEITINPIIYRSLSNLVFLQFEKWMIEHHITSLIEKEFIKIVQNRYVREKS